MNVLPELNLNKYPKDFKDRSLVDAFDMKINKDSYLLESDNNIINSNITDLILNKLNKEFTIIYIIPCNTELIIFIKDIDDITYLFRYNEEINDGYIYGNINYYGNKIIGTFTYNKNNLIICYSEYSETEDLNIPLCTINLGEYNKPTNNVINNNTIISEIKIPSVNLNYYNGRAYKGWYYIFVRYKIDDYNYTQWYNTNNSIFIDNNKLEFIEDYWLSVNNEPVDANEFRPSGSSYKARNKRFSINVSDDKDICNITFISNLNNNNNIYNTYQLGFIIVRTDYTKAFRTFDINVGNNYIFDLRTIIEDSVTNLITTYNNYYNVKTLTTYKNSLYIANYNENNKENTINCNNIKVNITEIKDETVIRTKSNNISTNINKLICKVDNTEFILDIISLDGNNYICKFDSVYGIYVNFGRQSKRIQTFAEHDKVIIGHESFGININKEENNSYTFNYKTVNTKDIYYYYDTDTETLTLRWSDIVIDLDFAILGATNSLGITKRWTNRITGREVYHYFKSYMNLIEIYDTNDVNDNITINNKINSSLNYYNKPDEYYNFFIHFVDKYGISTNGFQLKDFIVNSELETVNINNNLLLKTVSANNLKFEISNIPTDYIGFYISYEKFQNIIKYDGFTQLGDGSYDYINVYNIDFNVIESLDFNFNAVDIWDLGTNLSWIPDTTYNYLGRFRVKNKELKIADASNNILKSTNIEIFIDKLNINNNNTKHNYYLILRNTDINNLYNNNIKELIPCSNISYSLDTIVNTKTACYTNSSSLIFNNVFYDTNVFAFTKALNAIALKRGIKEYTSNDIIHTLNAFYDINKYGVYKIYNNEYFQINNKPDIQAFPIAGFNDGSISGKDKAFVFGYVTTLKNTVDLLKNKNVNYFEHYPKILSNYRIEDDYENIYTKTIRRSNIIQDESNVNNWRFFETDMYKNIIENKGDIIKLVSIGNIILVHTQHSLFQFNADDVLKSSNNKIEISNNDIWELNYKEVFTSTLGFAGINKSEHAIVGQFGYIFYEEDKSRIFRYDEGNIKQIDDNINYFIRTMKGRNLNIIDDIERDRLLFIFADNENIDIVSYNYKFNTFVSRHSTDYNIGYSTKNKTYLIKDKIYNFDNTKFRNPCSCSILINTNYDINKMLEFISYKINKVLELTNYGISPKNKEDNFYSGDILQIYSEECNTGELDIKVIKNNINSVRDYKKPYRELGQWNYNYIRNNCSNYPVNDRSDNMTRFYGNWFVVKFTFESDDCINIESLDCKFVKNLT